MRAQHFSATKVPLDAATWSSLIGHHLAIGDKKSAAETLQAMHRAGVALQNKGLSLVRRSAHFFFLPTLNPLNSLLPLFLASIFLHFFPFFFPVSFSNS